MQQNKSQSFGNNYGEIIPYLLLAMRFLLRQTLRAKSPEILEQRLAADVDICFPVTNIRVGSKTKSSTLTQAND